MMKSLIPVKQGALSAAPLCKQHIHFVPERILTH